MPESPSTTTTFSQAEINHYAQQFNWAITPTINPQTTEEEYWLEALIDLIVYGTHEEQEEHFLQSLTPQERQDLLQERILFQQ